MVLSLYSMYLRHWIHHHCPRCFEEEKEKKRTTVEKKILNTNSNVSKDHRTNRFVSEIISYLNKCQLCIRDSLLKHATYLPLYYGNDYSALFYLERFKAIRLIAIIVYMNRNNLECSYGKVGRVRLKKRYPNMKELNYIELSNVAYLCTYILHLYVANVLLNPR